MDNKQITQFFQIKNYVVFSFFPLQVEFGPMQYDRMVYV